MMATVFEVRGRLGAWRRAQSVRGLSVPDDGSGIESSAAVEGVLLGLALALALGIIGSRSKRSC